MKRHIQEYKQSCIEIVEIFARRFYKEVFKEEDFDYDITRYKNILIIHTEISDFYISFEDILIIEKYNIPCKIYKERYYKKLEEGLNINLYNYWKYYEIQSSKKDNRTKIRERKWKIT